MPLFPPTLLYCSLSTKSPTSPLRQMRNVFPFVGLSSVVWPVMAPSWTVQNSGLPSQPSSVLPSKIDSNPGSSSAAAAILASGGAARASKVNNATDQNLMASSDSERRDRGQMAARRANANCPLDSTYDNCRP